MLSKQVLSYAPRNVFCILAVFLLAGCLPSEEPDTPDQAPPVDDGGDNGSSHIVTGSVGDGPVIDAEIRITASDGRSLASTSSDSSANYQITVETNVADYPLSVLALGGTDLVTLTAPDFDMQSAVLSSADNSVANLNPFTTVAMQLAGELSGGATAENINAAMDIVFTELNSGLSSLNGVAAMNTEVSGGNIAELIRASEGLGELVRRVRDALSAVGRNESGNAIVAALGSDLVDGILDGRGGARADARIAAVAGIIRAQLALELMRNELRVQGADATVRMQSAMDQVFAGSVNPGFEELTTNNLLIGDLQLGAVAANSIQPNSAFDALLADASTLTSGMRASQVRQRTDNDARAGFETTIISVAGASASDIELLNDILRNGEPANENTAPTIAGSPVVSAMVGENYDFRPQASDADGDALTFSISVMPAWATFDTATGRLSGVPQATDVGNTPNIVISVSDGEATASLPAFTLSVDDVPANTPPVISGEPAGQVLVGSTYEFQPQASDADGDALTFSISGLPSWASFDSNNGRLSGTPTAGDVGVYSNIVITATDGEDTDSLAPFSISVEEITLGSATLTWTPPTLNTDGTPLTDLAGYRIYWGASSGVYTDSVQLDNPGLTTYVVENLVPGDWYFVSTAINAAGVESSYSNEAVKTVQ